MGGFWGKIGERGSVIVILKELVSTFGGSYVCANFGEN